MACRVPGVDSPRHDSGVRKLTERGHAVVPRALPCAFGAPSARLFLGGLLPSRARLRFTKRHEGILADDGTQGFPTFARRSYALENPASEQARLSGSPMRTLPKQTARSTLPPEPSHRGFRLSPTEKPEGPNHWALRTMSGCAHEARLLRGCATPQTVAPHAYGTLSVWASRNGMGT